MTDDHGGPADAIREENVPLLVEVNLPRGEIAGVTHKDQEAAIIAESGPGRDDAVAATSLGRKGGARKQLDLRRHGRNGQETHNRGKKEDTQQVSRHEGRRVVQLDAPFPFREATILSRLERLFSGRRY
jgi:hypothetical protein